MSRTDGRQPDDLRPLRAVLGELDRADGSGRFAFGPITSLSSFTGPIEVRLREERVDGATLEVVHRPLAGVGGVSSRALESTLVSVFSPLLNLSAYPRSLVQLVVQSLTPATPAAWPRTVEETEDGAQVSWPPKEFPAVGDDAPVGGSTLASRAAAINSATLAALHAGSVGMRAIPFAIALACVNGELVVDPTAEEEAAASARYAFAWAFGAGIGARKADMKDDDDDDEAEMVWAEAEGDFSKKDFNEARDDSIAAARVILDFVKGELETFFAQRRK